jgi:hypothetical protein
LIGVSSKGDLLDYGELQSEMTLTDGRLTGLPAGKQTSWADLAYTTSTRTFVVVVDADRPAKEVQKVAASLDKVCWGFGVAVGDKLGVALPAPCPAGAVAPKEDEQVSLALIADASNVQFVVTRVNEVETIGRANVEKKLVEYKKSEFFKGDPCPAERPEPRKESDEDEGSGTAMAFDMSTSGRCDVLLAFDEDAKMSDIVELFRIAMAAGFTEPHWVLESDLPPIKNPRPPSPPPPPPPPEVAKAQKKVDDAKAELMATIKDNSKSADDIKAANERVKRAEAELKAAKKKHKAAKKK